MGLGVVEVRRALGTVGGGVHVGLRGDAAWARLESPTPGLTPKPTQSRVLSRADPRSTRHATRGTDRTAYRPAQIAATAPSPKAAPTSESDGQILTARHGEGARRARGSPSMSGSAARAEGPGAAAEARSAVAQRRIVHPAEAAVSGPRLVVRLRGLEDARRACAEAADSAGRAHEGVPGDRGGSQDPLARRARDAGRSVRPTRASRVSEVGQRTGVHREARAAVVGGAWASRRSLSSRAARGKTATTRASTASSGTSC